MDYQKIYDNIINKAQLQLRIKTPSICYENHHIIPKCLGGSNDKENLVLLTPKEHFICHHLLTKIWNNDKLKFAFFAMTNQKTGDAPRDYHVSSRTYAYAKELFKLANSKLHKNKVLSEEHMSIIKSRMLSNGNPMKGKTGKNNPLFGRKRDEKTIELIKNTKLKYPEHCNHFKGYFYTPKGKFPSAAMAAKSHNICSTTIINWCKNLSDKIITQKLINSSSFELTTENLGRTFKEIGWYFVPM